MKTIIETTYKVKRAHSNITTKPLVDTAKLQTVRRFLLKKVTPFDYDVDVYNTDGYEFDLSTFTGDDFLDMSNPENYNQLT